jgi:hypothetical protein
VLIALFSLPVANEHPTYTSTIASLIAGDKVCRADAIDNTHVKMSPLNQGTGSKIKAVEVMIPFFCRSE